MAVRLDIVAQGATAATRAASFPDDEGLDAQVFDALESRRPDRSAYDAVRVSPARAAAETAGALGLEAETAPLLRDLDYGRWRGLRLKDVAAQEPDAFAAWLSDPAAAPHGGESVSDLIARTRLWLADALAGRGSVLAVAHAANLRAAVVCALGAPASAFWRVDAAPLSLARLSGHAGRWNLVALKTWDAAP